MDLRLTEIITISIYLLGCIIVGIIFSRRAHSTEEDFWVAGRFMGTVSGSLAIFADVATASSVIGVVGLAYKYGVPFAAMVAAAFTLQFPLACTWWPSPSGNGVCLLWGIISRNALAGEPMLYTLSSPSYL